MKKHPIQLEQLHNRELSVKIFDFNVCNKKNLKLNITYTIGHSEYNHSNKRLIVSFGCKVEEANKKTFELCVEVLGVFSVGDEFSEGNVEHFAKHNAPLILMPYVREGIYSLSSRADLKIILPLTQVPTNTKHIKI